MKLFEKALLCGIVFATLLSMTRFDARCDGIRDNVLRLHILANSDSEEDQALKLKVRDRLVKEGSGLFENARSREEAEALARENLPRLQAAAQDELRRQGSDYAVRVEVGQTHFGTRVYEDVTLPAGDYEAVRVLIGEAKGKNWWCVMFPAMCVPAASETGELSEVLGSDELDIVEHKDRYEIRFKAVELYEDIKAKIRSWF